MSWLNVYSQIVLHLCSSVPFPIQSCIKIIPELGTITPFPWRVLVGSFQDFRYLLSCLICHSLSDFSLHFNCLLHQPFYPFQFCTPFRSFQSISETYFTIRHHSALRFKPMSYNTNFQFANLTSIHILATLMLIFKFSIYAFSVPLYF